MFGFKLGKKNEPSCCCSCGEKAAEAVSEAVLGKIKSITVLGADGCTNCHTLLERVKEAVSALGLEIQPGFETDMKKIIGYGAMGMPGLVINEKLVSAGRLLKTQDVIKILGNITE